jgi:hypothetical protein
MTLTIKERSTGIGYTQQRNGDWASWQIFQCITNRSPDLSAWFHHYTEFSSMTKRKEAFSMHG